MGHTHREHAGRQRFRGHAGRAFGFTDHAIDQLRSRVMPQFTLARVKVEARILSASARRTDARSPDGAEIWEATDGAPIRFVVKAEHGRERMCVTVLEPKETAGADPEGDAA